MTTSKDTKIPASVKTIPDLIGWLAETRHDGTVSAISEQLGASVATASFWRRGVVLPGLDYLERLADHYHLPFDEVMDLWRKSRRKRRARATISGGSDAVLAPSVDPSSATLPHSPTTGGVFAAATRYYVNLILRLRHWLACPVYSFVLVSA